MSKPLSREELTKLVDGLSEEYDLEEYRKVIDKLVASHRSLWTASEAITAGWERDQEQLRRLRRAEARSGW